MADIVAFGELLAEFMAERVGQTFHEAGVFLGPYPSGAPGIFADQAAKTGASVAFIGCVGRDGFGDSIVNRLQGDGVDVSGIRRADTLPTGTAFVTYRPDGNRDFIYNIGNSAAAMIDAASVDEARLHGCRYLHVMGSSLGSEGAVALAKKAIGIVKGAGGKVTFDPNIRREILGSAMLRDALKYVLHVCDILLPSEADLAHFCAEVVEADAVARLMAEHAMRTVVVKKADKGCVYYDHARSLRVPSFKVAEVDPTGAGDCFGGTFVSCLAQGIELARALTLANAAGALAVTRRGPMEGNSTLAELDRFIAGAVRRS